MKSVSSVLSRIKYQFLSDCRNAQIGENQLHTENSWFDDADMFNALCRKVDPWVGTHWEAIKFADGTSLAQLVESILLPIDRRSQPVMRFYLTTVLKAHMFLRHRQKAWFNSASSRVVSFTNPVIEDFCESVLRKVIEFDDNAGKVILQILSMLDRYGDCPSVNRNLKCTAEKYYCKEELDHLSNTPLWRHTLNVAGRLTHRYCDPGESLERLLVLALAHDLGKIPKFSALPSDSHEQACLRALKEINDFYLLPYNGEIKEAICDHNGTSKPKTRLGLRLTKADEDARFWELYEDREIEEELQKITSMVSESLTAQQPAEFCRAIYPYFLDPNKLESLRYHLNAYIQANELVADLERIIKLPAYLYSEAFKVGTVIYDFGGGAFRTWDNCKEVI